jgi:serine/threonine protein kinase
MSIQIVDTSQNRYKNPRKITSTLSCIIYKATQNNNAVIIKKFRDDQYSQIHDHVIRETSILHNVDHPNIVKLLEIWPEPSYPSLILEFSGKSLWEYARPLTKILRAQIFDMIFTQVLSAIQYLHANNIIHRDIKATNVLIQGDRVKLCDFGLARRLTGDDLGTMAYTLNYRAPEILAGNSNYKSSADMWAIGCMMYDFITHDILFGNGDDQDTEDSIMTEILHEVPTSVEELEELNIDYEIPDVPKWIKIIRISPYLSVPKVNMLKSLLSISPSNRMSARECVQILGGATNPAQIRSPPFLMRQKIKLDLNLRYIMIVHILAIGDQFPISQFTIAAAVEIYDKFLMNQKKEIEQKQLILYYIASIILASCTHDSYRLYPSDFESVYQESDIVKAMKSLFYDVRYNIDTFSLWQIVAEQVRLGIIENDEAKLDKYWESVKKIYLDYESMIGLSKQQMTQKILGVN